MGQHGTLAAWLKQYRVAAGLTQERLAERANLSVRSLSNLERGLNRAPRPETLDRLMDVFELSWDERALLRVAALPADAATLAVTDIAPVDDAVVDLADLDASSADVRHVCDCGTPTCDCRTHQWLPAARTGTTAVTEVFPRTASWEHNRVSIWQAGDAVGNRKCLCSGAHTRANRRLSQEQGRNSGYGETVVRILP